MTDNVTPIRGRKELGPRAKSFLSGIRRAGDVPVQLDQPYVIKGWLSAGGSSLAYGPSNVGKSFWALDLAQHIATGTAWNGCRVRQTNVLYCALEGGASIGLRLAAIGEPAFHVFPGALSFQNATGDETFLAEAVLSLAETEGDFGLIVIDTLARVTAGADENAAADMTRLMACVDKLRAITGAHVLLIHHPGKDVGRGARGHSSIRAAIDTEIQITKEDDSQVIVAEVRKQRDGPVGLTFAYQLKEIELGQDADGDPVTSCIVEPTERPKKGAGVDGKVEAALQALEDAIATGGQRRTDADSIYLSAPCVTFAEWADMADRHNLSGAEKRPDRERVLRRYRDTLQKKGLIRAIDQYIWRVPQ